MAPPVSFIGPIRCNTITSSSPLFFSLTYNSPCHISLATKLHRNNVNVHGSYLSPITYQSLIHRNLYSVRHAKNSEPGGEGNNQVLDAVIKVYSAFKSKNQLSETNFLSFFLQAFQGKTQVLGFFADLIRILGDHIQIVVKPTPHDGMNIGVHWKFEWDKIHFPLGKGFSFHIYQTYHGKAVIKNIEMFLEPLLHLEPFRLKMKGSLTEMAKKIGLSRVAKSGNKAKRILCIVLAALSLVALLFFMKLASN